MIGTGFRSATRLASSSPSMMLDILTTNRKNVLQALNQFQATLLSIEEVLSKSDDHQLNDLLIRAVSKRDHINSLTGGKHETSRQ